VNSPSSQPSAPGKAIPINLLASAAVILGGLLCLRSDSIWLFALPSIPESLSWFFLLAGLFLIILAEVSFLTRGRATAAPGDPTRRLVISGIYRWVRNPIYLGGASILLGVALFRRSPTLSPAACFFLPILHLVVMLKGERRVERDFGSEYLEYKRKVPRWIPHPPK
jgi:protein-S-isoprenylcysteine O-methyltransferase Ste14